MPAHTAFDTPLGACAIAWGPAGEPGVARAVETKLRLLQIEGARFGAEPSLFDA